MLGRVLTGSEPLLDVGCGAGGSLDRFLTHHGPAGSAVGVDFSEGMLKRAAHGTRSHDPSVLMRWVLGDAEALPFADESFEVVLSVNCLSHLNRLEVALRGQYRVLRSGGIFALKFRGDLTLERPVERAMRSALARELPAKRLASILSMYEPASLEAAGAAAVEAGFEAVDVSSAREDWMADADEEVRRFPSIVGYMLEPLADGERDRVLKNFAQNLRDSARPEGLPDFNYSVTVTARRPL